MTREEIVERLDEAIRREGGDDILRAYHDIASRLRDDIAERSLPVPVDYVDSLGLRNVSMSPYQRNYPLCGGVRLVAQACPGGFNDCKLWTGSRDEFLEKKITRGQLLDLLSGLGVRT